MYILYREGEGGTARPEPDRGSLVTVSPLLAVHELSAPAQAGTNKLLKSPFTSYTQL
jgi:hypothetical protein